MRIVVRRRWRFFGRWGWRMYDGTGLRRRTVCESGWRFVYDHEALRDAEGLRAGAANAPIVVDEDPSE